VKSAFRDSDQWEFAGRPSTAGSKIAAVTRIPERLAVGKLILCQHATPNLK
jgi:hypothetical protein